jgi:hypothetical protein
MFSLLGIGEWDERQYGEIHGRLAYHDFSFCILENYGDRRHSRNRSTTYNFTGARP